MPAERPGVTGGMSAKDQEFENLLRAASSFFKAQPSQPSPNEDVTPESLKPKKHKRDE